MTRRIQFARPEQKFLACGVDDHPSPDAWLTPPLLRAASQNERPGRAPKTAIAWRMDFPPALRARQPRRPRAAETSSSPPRIPCLPYHFLVPLAGMFFGARRLGLLLLSPFNADCQVLLKLLRRPTFSTYFSSCELCPVQDQTCL